MVTLRLIEAVRVGEDCAVTVFKRSARVNALTVDEAKAINGCSLVNDKYMPSPRSFVIPVAGIVATFQDI